MGKTNEMPNADSFLHEPSRLCSWAHDRAFCTSACMLRVGESSAGARAAERDRGRSADHQRIASAVLPSFMGIDRA